MKDEGNHQGAVDKSFSEQRIHIVDTDYILCEKIGPAHVAEPGLTAGRWQMADEIQVNFKIFNNHCTSKDPTFSFV